MRFRWLACRDATAPVRSRQAGSERDARSQTTGFGMVHLDRIYTRGGDRGMTSLGDGTRVPKTDPRIVAYGTVDELNAVLGVGLRQPGLGTTAKRQLRDIQ